MNIFPNPAQDVITVRFLPDVAQYMQLADVMGHIRWSLDVSIGTGDSGEVSIDVSRLASGYYYFLLRDINGLIHSRSISIIH
ncbi:MAG: T9SS type A sorting domain-containing protein [Saprospiraceae bacterium]|nr:T9SS type A sorting domain-containing protein [Saprospiraceae bacterium]